jgi:hypothetical protein
MLFARENNNSHQRRLELKFSPFGGLNYFENLVAVRI